MNINVIFTRIVIPNHLKNLQIQSNYYFIIQDRYVNKKQQYESNRNRSTYILEKKRELYLVVQI